jgi:hypothetical protein
MGREGREEHAEREMAKTNTMDWLVKKLASTNMAKCDVLVGRC